jgi:hypothetical protein
MPFSLSRASRDGTGRCGLMKLLILTQAVADIGFSIMVCGSKTSENDRGQLRKEKGPPRMLWPGGNSTGPLQVTLERLNITTARVCLFSNMPVGKGIELMRGSCRPAKARQLPLPCWKSDGLRPCSYIETYPLREAIPTTKSGRGIQKVT